MLHATIVAGFGGQGLLFAGHVLAQAAMLEGRTVCWMPSYGPEMRGGTASCTVIVGDRPIGSPIVDAADSIIALNPPALAKFEPLLVPGGLLVINASLIDALPRRPGVEIVSIPCSAIARAAGDDRLVSIAALGALIARRPLVGIASIRTALEMLAGGHGPELVEANLVAFDRGHRASVTETGSRSAGAVAAR